MSGLAAVLSRSLSTSRWNNRLAMRLIVLTVLLNTVLSLFSTGFQLYYRYERDVQDTVAIFDIFDQSFKAPLSKAIWEFNFKQAEEIMIGLQSRREVVFLDLQATTGQRLTFGQSEPEEHTISRQMDLIYTTIGGETRPIGMLKMDVTLAYVDQLFWEQLVTILLANLFKTLLASIIMFALFYYLVARHLHTIASFVQSGDPSAKLTLQRRRGSDRDDLDSVVHAINAANDRHQRHMDHQALMNEELQSTNRRLLESNEELRQFSTVAAHDLQEPLRKIQIFGDLLRIEYQSSLDENGQAYIDRMTQAADRQKGLIKDLLEFSKVSQSRQIFAPVDLNLVMKQASLELEGSLEEIGGTISKDALPVVDGVDVLIRKLFGNLLSNAIKYRAADRPLQITISVKRDDQAARPEWVITVADNGIGFDNKHADAILEPFKRLQSGHQIRGTGMGLAICRKIIQQHNGELFAEGEVDKGSVFTIRLPVAKA